MSPIALLKDRESVTLLSFYHHRNLFWSHKAALGDWKDTMTNSMIGGTESTVNASLWAWGAGWEVFLWSVFLFIFSGCQIEECLWKRILISCLAGKTPVLWPAIQCRFRREMTRIIALNILSWRNGEQRGFSMGIWSPLSRNIAKTYIHEKQDSTEKIWIRVDQLSSNTATTDSMQCRTK